MADNQIEVNVKAIIEDGEIRYLQDTLEEIDNTSVSPDVDSSGLDEASNSAGEVADNLDQLFGLLDETASGFDNVGSSAGSAGDAMSDAGSGAEEAGAGFDDASGSADQLADSVDTLSMMEVGSTLQSWGQEAENMAQQMNEASITVGQLATQVGMNEGDMVNMISDISNATFPQEEAMAYVKSLDQIGVSQQNLGTSATGLDKINDAFGLGYQKVNSLGQELSVLGVDMNNVSSSYNALAYANANTVGGMENYYSFLRKYDAQFKELGINVDQASIIIAGATKKFGGGRAALTGLSTALKNAGGDTSALEQELGLASGSLKNASDITGEYKGQLEDLANEEAEHKSLLDHLGALWEDVSLKASGFLEPLMSAIGGIGVFTGFGSQLNGTLNLFSRMGLSIGNIGSTLSGLGGTIMSVLTNPATIAVLAIVALAIAIEQVGEWLGWWKDPMDMFNQALQWANENAGILLTMLMPVVGVIYNIGQAFGWWSSGSEMIDAITSGLGRLWEGLQNSTIVQEAIASLSEAFGMLWSACSEVFTALSGIFEAFGFNVQGSFDIVSVIFYALLYVIQYVATSISFVIRTMATVIQTIVTVCQMVYIGWTNIWNGINSVIRGAQGVIGGAISGINGFIQGCIGVYNNLRSTATSVFSAINSAVQSGVSAWNNFKSSVMSVIDPIISKINDLKSAASGIGDAIGGILGGGAGGYDINPTNVSNITSGAGGGNPTVFNITINGNIDSEARVNQLRDDFAKIVNGEITESNFEVDGI